MKRKAFTLIELLVVIAIIALLAAILFPVFARARENARRSSCQSNEKQIGLSIIQYIQDNDNYYPGQNSTSGTTTNLLTCTWQSAVWPYMKNSQIFTCPSNLTNITANPDYGPWTQTFGTIPDDYDMNPAVSGGHVVGGVGWFGIVDSLIAQPATCIMLGETDNNGQGNGIRLDTGAQGVGIQLWCYGGHFGGGNFLFCDGHVKWSKWSSTMEPSNEWLPAGPGTFGLAINGALPGGTGDTEAQFDAAGAGMDTFWANNTHI